MEELEELVLDNYYNNSFSYFGLKNNFSLCAKIPMNFWTHSKNIDFCLFDNTLLSLGVNLDEYKRLGRISLDERVGEVSQQIRAYRNEVLEDRPVSILYNYWLGESGELFTNSSLKSVFRAIDQFDFRERDGLPIENFRRVSELLLENNRKVVLSYSPAGPTDFEFSFSNPYSDINYNYGQLYIYYRDGKRVDSVAVKVSNEGVLREFMPGFFEKVNRAKSEREKIESYLLNPVVSNFTIWGFLKKERGEDFVYESKDGKSYSLEDIIFEVGERFKEDRIVDIFEREEVERILGEGEINSRDMFNIYVSEILSYADGQSVSLSGSCGGREVSVSGLRELLEGRRRDEFFSSGELDLYKSGFGIERGQKGWSYHFGKCRVCESEREVGPCEICKECEKGL